MCCCPLLSSSAFSVSANISAFLTITTFKMLLNTPEYAPSKIATELLFSHRNDAQLVLTGNQVPVNSTHSKPKSMATAPPPPSPQPASKSAVMPKLERAAPPRTAPPPPQPRIAAPSPPPRSAVPPPPPRMAAPPPPPPRMAAPPPPPPQMAAPAPPPRPAGKQCPPNVKCG